jgi:hypothetical protein
MGDMPENSGRPGARQSPAWSWETGQVTTSHNGVVTATAVFLPYQIRTSSVHTFVAGAWWKECG